MSNVHKVDHLGLTINGEPVIEYVIDDDSDGQHVVTVFRGYLLNYWHINEVPPEVRHRLREEFEADSSCIDCGYDPCECELGYGPVTPAGKD